MYSNRGSILQGPLGTALDLTTTASNEYLVNEPAQVEEIGIIIKTATVSSGGIVVTVTARPTVGSATGAVTIGTITIPTAIAAGKLYTNKVTPVSVSPGYSINVAVTTAAAGVGAAGNGYFVPKMSFSSETDANLAYATVVTA